MLNRLQMQRYEKVLYMKKDFTYRIYFCTVKPKEQMYMMSMLIMLTLLRDVFGELLGHPFFGKRK